MGSGDNNNNNNNKHHNNHLINFHLHMPHIHFHHHHHHYYNHHGGGGSAAGKKEASHIPKGCLAVLVGQGEEQRRFIIPVMYMNHPLFMELLKEAEEEFGFHHNGPINIPCHVEEFQHVQGMINKEKSQHHHHHHHHSNLHSWCFKA